MMAKIIVVILVLVAFGGAVFFYDGRNKVSAPAENSGEVSVRFPAGDNPSVAGSTSSPQEEMVVESAVVESVVNYTKDGFSPSVITVSAGAKVIFKNEGPRDFWPASAMHPTHEVYDGTNMSDHCAGGASPAFDSCAGIAPGSEWVFTFNKVGKWNYHDHLNAGKFGTIVVE